MGAINEAFSSNEIYFKKIEIILNYILSHEKNKSQNIYCLLEIGLAKQYSSITENKSSKNIINIPRNNKTLKYYINAFKEKSIFVKWTQHLFNLNEDDLNCNPQCNYKIKI